MNSIFGAEFQALKMGSASTPSPFVDQKASEPMSAKKPVLMRTICQALDAAILRNPETSLHWVRVVEESSLDVAPTMLWTFDDSLIQVAVSNGWSEGSLVMVYGQTDRYSPNNLRALFQVKLLCSPKKAFVEAAGILAFFESQEFASLLEDDSRYINPAACST